MTRKAGTNGPQRVQTLIYDTNNLKEIFAVQEPYAVINLAGEPIQKGRWTPARKKAILESRVALTNAIVNAIAGSERKPEVLINASAVGYYGTSETRVFTEESPAGDDFLADVCAAWEQAAGNASGHTRVVIVRIGVVLGKDGGALPKMMLPYRFFVGGVIGSGKQWVPWIHIDDVTGLISFAITNGSLSGAVNATAPAALRIKDLSKMLAKALRRPNIFPIPRLVLRWTLGEVATLLLSGQRVTPKAAVDAGYRFRFPILQEALKDLLGR